MQNATTEKMWKNRGKNLKKFMHEILVKNDKKL